MIRIEDVLTVKRELQFLFVTIAYAEIKKPITIHIEIIRGYWTVIEFLPRVCRMAIYLEVIGLSIQDEKTRMVIKCEMR